MIISSFEVELRDHQVQVLKAGEKYMNGEITAEEFESIQTRTPHRPSRAKWFNANLLDLLRRR